MPTYTYPDGGELDPRIETPELPEVQAQPGNAGPDAIHSPQTESTPASTETSPLQEVFGTILDQLIQTRIVWVLDRGAVELPTVGPILDDAIEEVWAIARLYRCDIRPQSVVIPTGRAAEQVITLAETLSRQAQRPLPLALATWIGNVSLQLMVVLGR